jgi:hypothetical protein
MSCCSANPFTSTTVKLSVISDDDREVIGVTSVDSRLFVLRQPTRQLLHVYDVQTFSQLPPLKVGGLSDKDVKGLTSCATNKCVYICDACCEDQEPKVFKVHLMPEGKSVSCWRIGSRPFDISINFDRNLLVAYQDAAKIEEYTTDGRIVRQYWLSLINPKLRAYQAIQISSEKLVVGCWNGKKGSHEEDDVFEIDLTGQIVTSYTDKLQSATKTKFNSPRHMSTDREKKFVLVADRWNNRIVVMNSSLVTCEHGLNVMSEYGGLGSPRCIYFDESRDRLFVGECRGRCRILVFDNFNLGGDKLTYRQYL